MTSSSSSPDLFLQKILLILRDVSSKLPPEDWAVISDNLGLLGSDLRSDARAQGLRKFLISFFNQITSPRDPITSAEQLLNSLEEFACPGSLAFKEALLRAVPAILESNVSFFDKKRRVLRNLKGLHKVFNIQCVHVQARAMPVTPNATPLRTASPAKHAAALHPVVDGDLLGSLPVFTSASFAAGSGVTQSIIAHPSSAPLHRMSSHMHSSVNVPPQPGVTSRDLKRAPLSGASQLSSFDDMTTTGPITTPPDGGDVSRHRRNSMSSASSRSHVVRVRGNSDSHLATPPSRSGAYPSHSTSRSGALLGGPALNIDRIKNYVKARPRVFNDIEEDTHSITANVMDSAPEAKAGKSRLTFTADAPNRVHVTFDYMTTQVADNILTAALNTGATYINLEKLKTDKQKQLTVINAYIGICQRSGLAPALEFRGLSNNVEGAYSQFKKNHIYARPTLKAASSSSSYSGGGHWGRSTAPMFRSGMPRSLSHSEEDEIAPSSPTSSLRSNSSSSSG
jgi:hypothetical protein